MGMSDDRRNQKGSTGTFKRIQRKPTRHLLSNKKSKGRINLKGEL
jgi:hypothetical protein